LAPFNCRNEVSFTGQAAQDRFAYEQIVVPFLRSCTFIDCGANDPHWNSNSFFLESIGWKGLLIDIDPAMCELCRQSRISPVIQADASTIDWAQLCNEHNFSKRFDYLSLDIDDYLHCIVLQNMIDAGLSFKVITVEHDRYANGDHPRDAIRRLLLNAGYTLAVPDVTVNIDGKWFEFEDWFVG
jgi:hypothetical protein